MIGTDPDGQRLARVALVAPKLRVLYVPTTKAACTTITMMIAQAEGTYRPELVDRVVTNHLSPDQTIHTASVNGLQRLGQLPRRQVRDILTSSDWLRITSTRHPLNRVYSAWENRLLLRASVFARRLADLAPDSVREGRLDLTATFKTFVTAFVSNTDEFMREHHFMSQTRFIRPDLIEFNRIFRVDTAGVLAQLATLLAERSKNGVSIVPQRLNVGLGIPLALVCDTENAEILMRAYQTDFDTFSFSLDEVRSTLSPHVSPYLLSTTETKLLHQLRGSIQRSLDIASATRVRQSVSFRTKRVMYAAMHKVSQRHVAIPQRYM